MQCLVLLQLDVPCFIDAHERPALSWMEKEEEGSRGVGAGELWGEAPRPGYKIDE